MWSSSRIKSYQYVYLDTTECGVPQGSKFTSMCIWILLNVEFLKDQKLPVCVSGYYFFFMKNECGVPQGSILEPIVFIYINDLPNVSSIVQFDISGTSMFHKDSVLNTS